MKILQTILIFIIGAIIILSTGWAANKFRKPEIIEKKEVVEKVISQLECPNNFEIYQDLIKKGQFVNLLENASSYATNGKFIKDYEITINKTGEIACGYLYVRARNDGKPLDEKYDSIYINPHDLGGHLLRSRSILILNPIVNKTETLLPLNAISFLSELPYNPMSQNYRIADWVKLLNAINQIKFNIALSTQDPTGFIDEVKIAYKCWNSQIGKETQDCQLSK
ncbi:hypothetical protein HZB04_03995 [Candidatus Wolfebacteria bacterium]|nr:hypothetical protein [Candidatus Wolfebacteria bacterium]